MGYRLTSHMPLIVLITDLDNTLYNFVDFFGPAFRAMVHALSKTYGLDEVELVDEFKEVFAHTGTIEFAFMFIPSEAVYYEVVNNNDLFDYGGSKRVLPVSATTFYAYMKAILMSFEGQKIEDRAREILAAIRAIQKDYNKVEDNLGVLGRHIQNAYNQMSNVFSSFTLLGQKLTSTQVIGESVKKEAKHDTIN